MAEAAWAQRTNRDSLSALSASRSFRDDGNRKMNVDSRSFTRWSDRGLPSFLHASVGSLSNARACIDSLLPACSIDVGHQSHDAPSRRSPCPFSLNKKRLVIDDCFVQLTRSHSIFATRVTVRVCIISPQLERCSLSHAPVHLNFVTMHPTGVSVSSSINSDTLSSLSPLRDWIILTPGLQKLQRFLRPRGIRGLFNRLDAALAGKCFPATVCVHATRP